MKKPRRNAGIDPNAGNVRNTRKTLTSAKREALLSLWFGRPHIVFGLGLALVLLAGVIGPATLEADDLMGAAQPEGSIEGSWVGKLVVGKSALTIVFNVKSENGGYSATMDSPDQGARGIPVSKLTVVGVQVRFEVKAVNGSYSGKLTQDGTRIVGQWQQSGMTLPLELEKKPQLSEGKPGQEQASNDKPTQQGPVLAKDTPYDEVEVRFPSLDIEFSAAQNGDTSEPKSPAPDGAQTAILAGTLSMPRGQGDGKSQGRAPFPAVVLVSGSGLQNRDEEIMGHKPFKVIADYLARRGIAVLRYDDRGFGQSTGDASSATTFDFARDAFGALEFLAKTDGIDAKRLGVIGHSEGGIVAAIIAAQQGQ
ncbi:MAG TPA: alpha/beta fold hydrolase, partial [Spirochaetales bacterium]|nr:alpha/beta fold hydrolase [Spirochaetales bacterium]